VPAWAFAVVDLWFTCRRNMGMMGSFTALPCSGGVGEQPAALMDAFALLDSNIDKEAE
jgi:hypothetical protein